MNKVIAKIKHFRQMWQHVGTQWEAQIVKTKQSICKEQINLWQSISSFSYIAGQSIMGAESQTKPAAKTSRFPGF